MGPGRAYKTRYSGSNNHFVLQIMRELTTTTQSTKQKRTSRMKYLPSTDRHQKIILKMGMFC